MLEGPSLTLYIFCCMLIDYCNSGFLLHGFFAVTGELTLRLPVNFRSSGFNKLAVPASRLQVQVQGTSLSSEYKSNCTSLSVVEV